MSKVTDIGEEKVRYKKWSNLDGPTYEIRVTDISSINYSNGERDDFSAVKAASDNSQGHVEKAADAANAKLLDLYNKYYEPSEKLRKKASKTPYYMLIFGFTPSSVLSNEDLEIRFERRIGDVYDSNKVGERLAYLYYVISIKNKSDKILYIDKGTSYKILPDETSVSFYDNTTHHIGQGTSSGASVNLGAITGIGGILGGISVGGGTSREHTVSYSQDRVLSIAPKGKAILSEEKYVNEGGDAPYPSISYAEYFNYDDLDRGGIRRPGCFLPLWIRFDNRKYAKLDLPEGLVAKGETVEYDENCTPMLQKYMIVYSTDPNFENYSSVEMGLYLREVIGCGKIYNMHKFWGLREFMSEEYIENFDENIIEGYYNCELKK